MAKTSADKLITDLAKRLDLDPTDATNVRPDMLRQLNVSHQNVLQDHSLSFLSTSGTLSLLNSGGGNSVAVPTTIDRGKAITLGRAAGDGEIEYVPQSEWFRANTDTYRMPGQTEPSYYTITQVSGTDTFLFKPANGTFGTLSIPYLAQLVPVAMTDASNSFSMLPEGWEDTLLLDSAEAELRRFHGEPFWSEVFDRANDKKERLYASYRTTKEQPMTDREQKERKVAKETLAPEKP
jgi:hypothetical protein